MSETPRPSFRLMLTATLKRVWPLLLLIAFLIWGWRNQSLRASIPQYGDTMEMMWVLSWYGKAIPAGTGITVYPLAFYPGGWHYSENLYMLLGMLPLHWLGGPAFAYNLVVLLTFIGAFFGAHLLASEFLDRLPATIAALLIVFWGGRWFHTLGHANILIGSALVPWILWTLNRSLHARQHRLAWLVATGVLWALSMVGLDVLRLAGGSGGVKLDHRQPGGQDHSLAHGRSKRGYTQRHRNRAQSAGHSLAVE